MKLPPLHALRAFDAVARLGGVRAAAQALFVTPGAVTQQLRALEEYFGLALVERRGRGIVMTDAGRTLHLATSRHLRAIGAASENLRLQPARVRVTAAHSVAVRWLVPKLKSFGRAHPEIEVMVDANPQVVDLRAGAWDLALREGEGRYPHHHSELLLTLDVVPVAAPDYVRRELRIARTRWQRARLLHDVGNAWWERWLDDAQASRDDSSQSMYFSNTAMAIAAAADGQGVALAAPFLVRQELVEGRLVVVDPRLLVTGTGVYAVWPTPDEQASSAARIFRRWLLAEAVADRVESPRDPAPRRRRPVARAS
jgi:LysR family transcriptional regulator, glycine cleavage system transcriptional activator